MDWDNIIADEERILTCHYTPGRSAKIDKIVVHHNAGNLSIADCYNVWQSREASAHYQVDINGRVGQLVNDWDTAWHAGNANPSSIGIEHANNNTSTWTVSDATLESGAHLVAALCKHYGLGRPKWKVNVFPHSYFMSTACPGAIGGSQNAKYMKRAQYWYDVMTGAATEGGWQGSGDSQWYKYSDGSYPANKWEKIDGKWYYFDADGYVASGWQKVDGKWYYLHMSHDGHYGEMHTGWHKDGNKWYYLNSSGVMQTGWVKVNSKWYFMGNSGAMQTGWLKRGDAWYYLTDSGAALTSTCAQIKGKWYAFGSDSKMLTRVSVESNGALNL